MSTEAAAFRCARVAELLPRNARRSIQALDEAAIDGNGCTGYITGALGGEKYDHIGEFLRAREPSQWNLTGPALFNLLAGFAAGRGEPVGQLIQPRGQRVARAYIVYENVGRPVFVRKRLHQPGD